MAEITTGDKVEEKKVEVKVSGNTEVKPNENSANSAPPPEVVDPYKKEQFEAFLQTIGRKSVGHWVQMAKALGVDRDTIAAWKKHPLAQKVIKDEIEKCLEGMEESGSKDWKMWESRAKMLGVAPIEKSDITSDGEKLDFKVISYDEVVKNVAKKKNE